MAKSVADYDQSDRLFLYKTHDGKIVGYSGQFDACTEDVLAAVTEDYPSARWRGCADFGSWVPATIVEIRAAGLGAHVLGFKRDTSKRGLLEPVGD